MESTSPTASSKGSYHIKTFGCQMNLHDSERMSALLAEQGYASINEIEKADVVIFNSCSIRDKSEQKAYSAMGLLKNGKKVNPKMKIGFTGCVAQQDGKAVFSGAPHLDFVIGTDSIDALPEVLFRVKNGEKKVLEVGFDPSQNYSLETKVLPDRALAQVNIMKGCDNFCSYCIVPFTRGREKSRTIAEVVQDVKRLVLGGVVEVMLLGQNVNSYGKSLGGKAKGQSFPLLLRELQAMADRMEAEGITDPTGKSKKPPGLLRIRYTTSHPKDFSEEMIAAHAELSRVMPHLHLPVQSGSAKVLKRMKRYVPIKTYIERMAKLRELIPHITITTDMIVGFPGEEESDFENTLELLRVIRFDNIFAYTYSPRPGTAALKFGDPVTEAEKKSRLLRLQHLQNQIQAETNQTYKGSVQEVLVEGPSKTNPEILTGRTPGYKIVNFAVPSKIPARDLVGKQVRVIINQVTTFSLRGEMQ